MNEHYEVLGVAKEASPEEIKKAYRSKAGKTHPDKEGGNHEAFVALQRAYAVLSDPDKRSHYDQYGADPGTQTLMDEAKQELATYFSQLVANVVSEGRFRGHIDIVHELTAHLDNMKVALKAQRVKSVRLGKSLRKVKRKLSVKSPGDRLLFDVLAQQEMGLRRDYMAAKNHSKKVELMLELVDNYSYDADEAPVHTGQWSTSTFHT